MTTDSFRSMCAELIDAYTWCIEEYMTAPAEEDTLIQRARALLDQPEPEGPTDEELVKTASDAGLCYPVCWDLPENEMQMKYLRNFAHAVLAKWGHQ